jgi:tetratricopeptide (TPR) repeat protein
VQHHQAGDVQLAEQLYRQVLLLKPDCAEAHMNLGAILQEKGKLDEAVASYQQTLSLKPDFAKAHANLGSVLAEQGKLHEAQASLERSLRLIPDNATAHNNLGHVLTEQGKLDEAAASYRRALRLKPDYAEAHLNLGVALMEQGKLDDAVQSCEHALSLRPDFAKGHLVLGNMLKEQGKLDEAVVHCQRALRLKPDDADIHNNLALVLAAQNKMDEALASYQRALRLRPDFAQAHMNLGMNLLLLGNFEQGWQEYEWRFQCKEKYLPPFPQPLWDGSSLDGRTILLAAEQGSGDTLQFIRCAPLVQERGGRVLLACQPTLVPLLARCKGVERLLPIGSPLPDFDVYVPLMSLPRILGTSAPERIFADIPYVIADPGLVEQWRVRLRDLSDLRVGIAWQGSPTYRGDRRRSIPLKHFEPLTLLPGVRLISLQKGVGSEQLPPLADRFGITDLGSTLDESTGPFMDTAAVMKNLDLVVASDTAIAHLAGALGVPVWVALPFVPDWRWMLQREDSPWYPTMRLFRQRAWGDWDEVFARIASELQKLPKRVKQTQRQRQTGSISVEIAPGELIDRITILQIKNERITDARKLANVQRELAALEAVKTATLPSTEQLEELTRGLRSVNETLWQVEDDIRACERNADFGPDFIALARSVYKQNDRRFALKRQINELFGSELVEEKEYTSHGAAH